LNALRQSLGASGVDAAGYQRVSTAWTAAHELVERHEALRLAALELVYAMNFRFLFDERRCVFSIGYNVADGRRDNSYYDLLASEARLASFLAIAKSDVPQE